MAKVFSILLVVTFHFSLAWAQVTTGTVLGTVQDATGAVLPGTEVTVTHLDTAISRTVISDDEGRYLAPNLNLGDYEIAASLPGFQTEVRTGIELTIGRRAVVNFNLNVGEITERVTVTGEAPLVETTSGALGSLVDRHTVLELPLNGRDLTSLMTLQPGAVHVTTAGGLGEGGVNNGYSQRVSVGGARPHDSAVLLDGSSVKGSDQGVPAGVSGSFLGGEAVQEFRVERNSYSAQFGGAAGGVINVVSKAGGNEFHGSIYEYIRNDNLDASDFFSKLDAGLEKAEFIRNQYGFSIGGPIIENQTFFFFNFEGMRERKAQARSRTLPTDATRNGFLPLEVDSNGDIVLDSRGRPSIDEGAPLADMRQFAAFDPGVLRYLTTDFYPLAASNTIDQEDGTTEERFDTPRPVSEDYYQLRVDHNFSESDSIFGRYTWQDSDRNAIHDIPFWSTAEIVENDFSTFEEKHIFSPQLLNIARVGIGRRQNFATSTEQDGCCNPALNFIPLDKFKTPTFGTEESKQPTMGEYNPGGLSAAGVSAPAGGANGWTFAKTTNYQWQDDIIYNTGPHSLKAGFSWHRVDFGGENPSRIAGDFSFSNMVRFMFNQPSRFRGNLLEDSDGIRDFHTDIIAWYLQDDWQISPKLTANLGLRHEFFTVPTEADGKLSNMKSPLTDTGVTVNGKNGDSWFENPSVKSFMPRIGFAYDPTGSGKTAFRLGAGLFYNHIQPGAFRRAGFRNTPHMREQNFRSGLNGTFAPGDDPNGVYRQVTEQGIGSEDIQPFAYDYMKNPHTYQWNLNIQHEVLPGAAVTIGYAGSRGLNLFHQTCINMGVADNVNGRLVYADDATVRNTAPAIADLCLLSQETSVDSWYHSLQTGFQRRFRDGWQLQVSYTFSRTIDESSQVNGSFSNQGGGVSYYPEPDLRRSLAAFHVQNAFSASSVIELPFGQGKALGNSWNNAVNTVLGGWQLSTIVRLADGPAQTITMSDSDFVDDLELRQQMPDLIPGNSLSPVLGTKDHLHYFDVSGFRPPPANTDPASPNFGEIVTIGNVGRNTLIAPGIANIDLSLTKNNQITEDINVQFRAEFFNAFNRANFRAPRTNLFRDDGRVRSNAGELRSLTTRPRQIQFGLRILF